MKTVGSLSTSGEVLNSRQMVLMFGKLSLALLRWGGGLP